MERNIDRGLDKRTETHRGNDSKQESKMEKVVKETQKKISDALRPKR